MRIDADPTSATSSAPPKVASRKLITAACMLVMVLASMEMTITSTAMPTIIGDLHGLEHYGWVASIYLLALAVVMPMYGRLADMLGRKPVLLFAIALFLLASLGASTAQSMPQLIFWRGLQGMGGAGVMPTVLTLLADIFTLQERARIQGLFSAIWGTSSLAGPALGALLVNTLGWRSIFYVNLPPGLIGLAAIAFFYKESLPQTRRFSFNHIDLPGFTCLSIATSALLCCVSIPWNAWWTPGLLVLSAIGWVTFMRREKQTVDPILPMSLVRRADIWPSVLGSALLGVVFLSLDTYVPLYVQGGQGGGAAAAAGVVTPVMLAWAISGLYSAPMVYKWGFRKTSMFGSALVVMGQGLLVWAALASAGKVAMTVALVITGFGLGPASMSFLLAAQTLVATPQRGTITSAVQLARTLGGAVGIGLHGAVFALLSRGMMDKLSAAGYAPATLLDPKAMELLPPAILAESQLAIRTNLTWVFVGMAGFALFQLINSAKMPRKACDHKPTPQETIESVSAA